MDYDKLELGDRIPPLALHLSIVQLVMYCAATWDFARLHYDRGYSLGGMGFPQPVVDPQMHGALVARMLTDWLSGSGFIRKLSLSYRSPCFMGDDVTYSGTVTAKYINDGEKLIECDIQVENQKAEHPVTASATILLY